MQSDENEKNTHSSVSSQHIVAGSMSCITASFVYSDLNFQMFVTYNHRRAITVRHFSVSYYYTLLMELKEEQQQQQQWTKIPDDLVGPLSVGTPLIMDTLWCV